MSARKFFGGLVAAVFGFGVSVASGETIFQDNFDSYTTGDPPSDPPWSL